MPQHVLQNLSEAGHLDSASGMSSPLNSALRLATKVLPKSNSAKAFDAARANKTGLSKALDVTLRTDHDMRVFGLGFMASLSSADVYRHFMQQHYFFYRAMEQQFDACVEYVKLIFGQQ